MQQYKLSISQIILAAVTLLLCSDSFSVLYADTVSGGGYTVNQTFSPVSGSVQGNGYVVNQTGQEVDGQTTGNGYNLFAPLGGSNPAPVTPPSGGGGGGGGGGGYYILPPYLGTTTIATTTATSTKPKDSILTPNGSTCKTRITFSSPIDVGSLENKKEDVEKLEYFLNTYENEKLPINGLYENKDVIAVKRWQSKYQSFILAPMKLKKPTGTVYTLSQRQIERQTTKSCGQPIVVASCPFFKTYTKYGDRNDEVKRIQQFLNVVRGEKLPINGVFGPATRDAVKRFQRFYRKDIVNIVTLDFISGNWNVSTRTKANEIIGCDILK